MMPGQLLFLGFWALIAAILLGWSWRRDRTLAVIVATSLVVYLSGAALMGVYLREVRGREYMAHDEVGFQREGTNILEGWRSGRHYVVKVPGFYPVWNAVVISVWGPSLLPMRIANAFAGCLTIVAAYLLGERLFQTLLAARLAALLALFSPSGLLWTLVNLKERWLGLAIAVTVLATISLVRQWHVVRLGLFLGGLYAVGLLRHYYAPILGWIAIAGYLTLNPLSGRRKLATAVALILSAGLVLQVVTGSFMGTGIRKETINRYIRISAPEPDIAIPAPADVGRGERVTGIPDVGTLIRNAAFVLFGRFASQDGAGRVAAFVLLPEWLSTFLLFPLALWAVWTEVRNRRYHILLPAAFICAMIAVLSVIHGEPWTTYRFRSIYWVLFLVLAAGGINAIVQRTRQADVSQEAVALTASRGAVA